MSVVSTDNGSKNVGNCDDAEYDKYLSRMQDKFMKNIENGKVSLFTTDSASASLWEAYLDSFGPSEELKQYHDCNNCKSFITKFGGLVTINDDGTTSSPIWDENDTPEQYKKSISSILKIIRKSKVNGVFISSDIHLGNNITGSWKHLSLNLHESMIHKGMILNAHQASAAKKEDFKTVIRALEEFTQPHLDMAVTLLKTDSLYRSEKVLGQAEWLHDLHVKRSNVHGSLKNNIVWKEIARAPAGFCHPRASMIGTLLEDIASGMNFEQVSKRFADKMHPLKYQRPQALPSSGSIAVAEKLIKKLGAAGSLKRRYAKLEEIQKVWEPKKTEADKKDGIFGHLKTKGSDDSILMSIPAKKMTWEKFSKEVLPDAESIEIKAVGSGPYTSLLTSVNPDSPPILQWDKEEKRNPFSWYFWYGGSTAAQFGLNRNSYYRVNAISLKPSMWNGGFEHHGKGVLFVIDGAADTKNNGICLFPETLKSELREARSVLESYSNTERLIGQNEQSAAGLMFCDNSSWNANIRVKIKGKTIEYHLDRWD